MVIQTLSATVPRAPWRVIGIVIGAVVAFAIFAVAALRRSPAGEAGGGGGLGEAPRFLSPAAPQRVGVYQRHCRRRNA